MWSGVQLGAWADGVLASSLLLDDSCQLINNVDMPETERKGFGIAGSHGLQLDGGHVVSSRNRGFIQSSHFK